MKNSTGIMKIGLSQIEIKLYNDIINIHNLNDPHPMKKTPICKRWNTKVEQSNNNSSTNKSERNDKFMTNNYELNDNQQEIYDIIMNIEHAYLAYQNNLIDYAIDVALRYANTNDLGINLNKKERNTLKKYLKEEKEEESI